MLFGRHARDLLSHPIGPDQDGLTDQALGDGRFAGPGDAHEDHRVEGPVAILDVVPGKEIILPGPALRGLLVRLIREGVRGKALDFAPHHRPVDLIEPEKLGLGRLGEQREIGVGEGGGKIESAAVLQVHEQESYVFEHVAYPESLVEFDAVDDDRGADETNMAGMEVSVAFSREARSAFALEERPVSSP